MKEFFVQIIILKRSTNALVKSFSKLQEQGSLLITMIQAKALEGRSIDRGKYPCPHRPHIE